jgi:tRNA-binding protein
MSETISFDDFLKVDIRVGTIVDAQPFPEARRPAIKMWVDFGPDIGVKKTSAQITKYYDPQGLIGGQIAGVINFAPRQIGPFMSEFLALGFPDGEEDNGIVLIRPEQKVPNGGRMF